MESRAHQRKPTRNRPPFRVISSRSGQLLGEYQTEVEARTRAARATVPVDVYSGNGGIYGLGEVIACYPLPTRRSEAKKRREQEELAFYRRTGSGPVAMTLSRPKSPNLPPDPRPEPPKK